MTEKKYTQNFFDRCVPVWEKYLSEFQGKENLWFLEVGSFEGRSTCWLMDNILTHPSSCITCIDLFDGAGKQGDWSKELYDRYDMPQAYQSFLNNTQEYGSRVAHKVGPSNILLREKTACVFDCIYIDGSHIACDVLEDIVLAWPLLKKDGIMILDDYEWDMFGNPLRHPKIAIDAFLEVYKGQYEVLYKGYQIILRKTGKREVDE